MPPFNQKQEVSAFQFYQCSEGRILGSLFDRQAVTSIARGRIKDLNPCRQSQDELGRIHVGKRLLEDFEAGKNIERQILHLMG